MTTLFDNIESWSTSPWFYLAIVVVSLLDSVVPIVPSEATVILGGTAAGLGDLSLPIVIALAAVGALLGDSMAYDLGHRLSDRAEKLFFRGDKGPQRLETTKRQIAKRGGSLLLTARFIPGGRTALTITCGVTGQPYRSWFLRWDLAAVILWATYAAGLGFYFGQRFSHTKAFFFAFATAVTFTGAVEIVQWLRARRRGAEPGGSQ